MNGVGGDDLMSDDVVEQAVGWFVRMRKPHSQADESELEEWLGQSFEHRRAYEWAKQHFENSELLKASARHGHSRPAGSHRWLIGASIAAAIVICVAAGIWPRFRAEKATIDQASTAAVVQSLPGQIKFVALGKGMHMIMDTGSRVAIKVDQRERSLQLIRGHVRITVQPDQRPFRLEAGDGELVVKNALFDIGKTEEGRIEIAVLSGEIELRRLLEPAVIRTGGTRFRAGQSVGYFASHYLPVTLPRNGIDRRSWPAGWADYDAVPLRVLIADANRYAKKPIILDDAALGDRLVSGRFRLTHTDRFAARIAELFDLAMVRRENGIRLGQR